MKCKRNTPTIVLKLIFCWITVKVWQFSKRQEIIQRCRSILRFIYCDIEYHAIRRIVRNQFYVSNNRVQTSYVESVRWNQLFGFTIKNHRNICNSMTKNNYHFVVGHGSFLPLQLSFFRFLFASRLTQTKVVLLFTMRCPLAKREMNTNKLLSLE